MGKPKAPKSEKKVEEKTKYKALGLHISARKYDKELRKNLPKCKVSAMASLYFGKGFEYQVRRFVQALKAQQGSENHLVTPERIANVLPGLKVFPVQIGGIYIASGERPTRKSRKNKEAAQEEPEPVDGSD